MQSSDEPTAGWSMVPTVLLRQAGYPMADLAPLADPELVQATTEALKAWREGLAAAAALRPALRGSSAASDGAGASVGRLKPLSPAQVAELSAPTGVLRRYSEAATGLAGQLSEMEIRHRRSLARARQYLVDLFRDVGRQQVLLLASSSAYEQFREVMHRPPEGRRGRRLTDLLAMYLQRITTKNETNSHFGPISLGHVDATGPGLGWAVRDSPERFVFLAHWAATALLDAGLAGADCEQRRPRRYPLAFSSGAEARRYEYVTAAGMPYPWQLTGPRRVELPEPAQWLLGQVDGQQTVGQLRRGWTARHGPTGFDEAWAVLADAGLVIDRPELPAGDPDTLTSLRSALADLGGDSRAADRVARLLRDFATSPPHQRAPRLRALSDFFRHTVGVTPTRAPGRHYADRGIIFEDCLSRVREVRLGRELERFITDELAEVYDGLLLGPRLRLRREREILTRWFVNALGADRDVPLGEVYPRFIADESWLSRQCDTVDMEVAAAERRLAQELLRSWDGRADEVVVPAGTIRAVVAAYPPGPPAVCNPDVMLGATGRDAFRTGEFIGVVGDCHAVRDLLTHGPFAALLAARTPGLVQQVLAGYTCLLDHDEVLVDVVRDHRSKVSSQLELPVPHLEVAGRSPKHRGAVLVPADLTLAVRGGRMELRTSRLTGRLRLMASPSGAHSIRNDPLSIFSFPRSLGGGLLCGVAEPQLPRLRTGRVVLSRRRWLVRVSDLDAWRPQRRFDSPDARQFGSATLLRSRYGLPRHVFVKFRHEPKPVYVDWSAPMLVRQLYRLAGGADPADQVEISEMVPGPDELWLSIDGRQHTSELRCTLFSRAARESAQGGQSS